MNIWRQAPALFYGILFLLGTAFALFFHPAYLIPLIVCLGTNREHLYKGLFACLLGVAWAFFSYSLPQLPEEGVEKEGIFKIESVSYSHSPFQRSILYQGILNKVPCRIYFKENKPRPLGRSDLYVKGRLLSKGHHLYVLKPSTCDPIPGTHSLAEWRFGIKNKLRSHLEHSFQNSKSRSFLLSMLTGETDDRLLSLEFNRLGILHLLGISGFQFALLAFLLGSALRLIFPHNTAYIFLMILLTAYAFILGNSPPIERAWMGTVLYLTALLCGYRISALNALGLALLWQLIKDPLVIFHLGFQFSFLCTAAILLLYPLFKSGARRPFRELIGMSLLDQHGHLLSFFCRETLALNGAIHLATLPLILFHFHKFPVLSLLYNLFLPALVSIVYLLLIIGLVCPYIHVITGALTDFILKVATHPPALYDFQWRVSSFSLTLAVTMVTAILFSERLQGFVKSAWHRIVAIKV